MVSANELRKIRSAQSAEERVDDESIMALALQILGFSTIAPLDINTLEPLQSIRDMCESGKCQMVGKQWTCPPACGTLDELRYRIKSYNKGFILQHIAQLDDDFDIETMLETEVLHQDQFMRFFAQLQVQYPSLFPMTAGACKLCQTCTYPDSPCRFPDLAFPSMEAAGLFVSQVCEKNNVKYYYGPRTIAFTSCVLLE